MMIGRSTVILAAVLCSLSCGALAAPPNKAAKSSAGSTMAARRVVLQGAEIAFSIPDGYVSKDFDPKEAETDKVLYMCVKWNRTGYSTNINLITETNPVATKDFSDADFQIIVKKYPKLTPDYQVVGSARIQVAGENAVSIAGEFSLHHPQNPDQVISLRNRQVFILHKQRIYIFTFTADADMFDVEVPAFEKLVNGISWIAPVKTK